MAYIDPVLLSRTNILFLLLLGGLVGAWVLTNSISSSGGQSKVKRYIAGPYPLPLLGNIFTFSALKHSPDIKLLTLARKYGNVCMLWFGSNPVIIVNSPQTAKELMDRRGSIYSSRPTQNEFRARAWPWRLVTTPTGDTFRRLRKIYHNLLGRQQSASFRKYQDFESKVMISALLDRPQGFLMDAERFAMSVIFSACYGVRLAQLDHPTMTEFYSVWDVMLRYFQPGSMLLDFVPILQRLPTALKPWLKLADSFRERELKLHRAFLKTLKKQTDDRNQIQEQEHIDDDQACNILAMLIGAGADTTSSYLQSFFKVMALHPEVWEKAQAELDRVVGSSRLPIWEDEASLPYVRAVIKEIHRWAPIGSLGVPHATSKADIYDGGLIPEGTVVFPNGTALNRSPERYSNPDLFAPERFLGDNLDASSSALDPDFKKRDHFHYGFGRRLCQGIFVAEASLYIVVARVLWGFDIRPLKGAKPLNMDEKIAGLVTKPKPYKVSIKSRGATYEKTIRQSMMDAKTDILNFDDISFEDIAY